MSSKSIHKTTVTLTRDNPHILELLLKDQTLSNGNDNEYIRWTTDEYESAHSGEIRPQYFAGMRKDIICPRTLKHQSQQHSRAKKRAEIFTPAWICNAQNNLIDEQWFGRKEVFNKETILADGTHSWIVSTQNVSFENGRSWTSYISSKRMEMACGEAPYTVSRYDATTGEAIPLHRRIGTLDRKMRVINENIPPTPTITNRRRWLRKAYQALQATYGFDLQGDNIFLARESILLSFCEYYKAKWGKLPNTKAIAKAAEIISWNIWQMDGTTYTIPDTDIFCYIMDWSGTSPLSGEKLQFKQLIKNNNK